MQLESSDDSLTQPLAISPPLGRYTTRKRGGERRRLVCVAKGPPDKKKPNMAVMCSFGIGCVPLRSV